MIYFRRERAHSQGVYKKASRYSVLLGKNTEDYDYNFQSAPCTFERTNWPKKTSEIDYYKEQKRTYVE
jgi:hypothetical protein